MSRFGSAFDTPRSPVRTRKPGAWGSAFSKPTPKARRMVYRDANGDIESIVEEREGAESVIRWVVRDDNGDIISVEED